MLLFDNLIFASFIPQILMFLGFISCVSTSIFKTATDEITSNIVNEVDVVVHTSAPSDAFLSAYFFDNHSLAKDALHDEHVEHFPFSSSECVIRLNDYICPFLTNQFSHSIFSRPPPFFTNI